MFFSKTHSAEKTLGLFHNNNTKLLSVPLDQNITKKVTLHARKRISLTETTEKMYDVFFEFLNSNSECFGMSLCAEKTKGCALVSPLLLQGLKNFGLVRDSNPRTCFTLLSVPKSELTLTPSGSEESMVETQCNLYISVNQICYFASLASPGLSNDSGTFR